MGLVRKILILGLAVMMCAAFLPASLNCAYADDVSEYVTGLAVSPENIETNGRVTVEVTFSDGSPDRHVFHGGDTIEITWPNSGQAYLQGYPTTIPLITEDGVTYAWVRVTSQGAVITFTDAVNDMYDISGHFYFSLMGYNKSEGNEADTQTVTMTAGDQTADIQITKPASGSGTPGELPDFRKEASGIGGWTHMEGIEGWVMTLDPEDPTYTEWVLTANENRETVTYDIVIRDTLGPGQEIDYTWAELYSGGTQGKYYSGTLTEVISAFKEDFPESELRFDENGNILWKLDPAAVSGESWCLTYRCDITDFSLLTFTNSATMTRTGDDGETYSVADSSQFANLDQGGGIVGLPRGVLQITKKITGTDMTLQGVVFRVERLDGTEWVEVGQMTTNENGIAAMTRLRTGHYRLYETDAPAYLDMEYTEESPCEFDIDTENTELQSLALTVENTVKQTGISASKIWLTADGGEDGSEHPTIYFRLYRTNTGTGKTTGVGEPKALEDGATLVSWGELPQYDVRGNQYIYFVKETDAEGNDWVPQGYVKTEDGLTVINRKEPMSTDDTGSSGDTGSIGDTGSSGDSETRADDSVPKTGDDTGLMGRLAICLASFPATFSLLKGRKRQ